MADPLLRQIIESLRILPGVGPKSAQRMLHYLLNRNRAGGKRLAQLLSRGMDEIEYCAQCRNFSEHTLCDICANPKRGTQQLCVVGSPADLQAIEETAVYAGLYFVLHGHLSPIDGIGPEQIGLPELENILAQKNIEEVVLATNPTVEGEATAHYIGMLCHAKNIAVTRIACGVPMGGDLEYVDGATIARALVQRNRVPS